MEILKKILLCMYYKPILDIGFDFLQVFLKLYQAVVTKRHSKCTRKLYLGAFQRVLYAKRTTVRTVFEERAQALHRCFSVQKWIWVGRMLVLSTEERGIALEENPPPPPPPQPQPPFGSSL
jgi:hypothetical protein